MLQQVQNLPAQAADAVPEPWTYNPSAWRQRIAISILAGAAFVIATYMGLYQWRLIDTVWDPVFGSQSLAVLDSDVSHTLRGWFLIPDAILGALAYLSDIVFAMAGCTRRWQYRPWLVMLFGLDVIPLGIVSAVLVALQGLVVGAWCFLCLVTALISVLLVFLAYDEVWSCWLYLRGIARRSGRWGPAWSAFWGRPLAVAHQVGRQMVGEA